MSYLKKITQRSYYYLKLHSAKSNTLGHILINYLILQPKCKFVLQYKELILNGETLEILEKFYKRQLSKNYLKSLFYLYTKYIKVYPNYLVIDIDNILMNNIKSKQNILNNYFEDYIKKNDFISENRKTILNEINSIDSYYIFPDYFSNDEIDFYSYNRKKFIRTKNDSNEEIEKLIWIIDNSIKYSNKKYINLKKKNNITYDFLVNKNIEEYEKKNYSNKKEEKDIKNNINNNKQNENEKDNKIYKSKFKSIGEFLYIQKQKENKSLNFNNEEKKIKNTIFKNILQYKK